MNKSDEYAEVLRIGERNRDASDKIRGFLYQDLLAVDLILDSNEDEKIYVEWIEDIFIEDPRTISIFQVKHYPESSINFGDIYENLLYQFLKYKLYESENKKFKTYCLYHTSKNDDFANESSVSYAKKEIKFDDIDKVDIKSKLEECRDMSSRKALIFSEIACTKLVEEFDFKKESKEDIYEIRSQLGHKLYSYIITNDEQTQENERIYLEEVLLAISIQYIQKSYYNKPEDYKLRCMTKSQLIKYISEMIMIDEKSRTNRIKFIVLGYVDDLASQIFSEIEEEDNIEKYRKIYFSTKEFFMKKLENKRQRFKFLNSISTDNYNELNWEDYNQGKKLEIYSFLEHKGNIKQFINTIWKIMYNLECTDFDRYINEYDDNLLFQFPNERVNPTIIISTTNGDTRRAASSALMRIKKMKMKPKKWYFKGCLREVYSYSVNVARIREAKLDGDFSVLYSEDDCFKIECMDCVACGEEEMGIKDKNLNNGLFNFKCIKGD